MKLKITDTVTFGNELLPKADETIADLWLSTDEGTATITDLNVPGTDVSIPSSNLPKKITIDLPSSEVMSLLKIKASTAGKFIKDYVLRYSSDGGTSYTEISSSTAASLSGTWLEIDLGGITGNSVELEIVSTYGTSEVLIDEMKLVRNDLQPAAIVNCHYDYSLNGIGTDNYVPSSVHKCAGIYCEKTNRVYAAFKFNASATLDDVTLSNGSYRDLVFADVDLGKFLETCGVFLVCPLLSEKVDVLFL